MIEPKLGPLGPLVPIGWHNGNSAARILWDKVEGPELKRQFFSNNGVLDLAPSVLRLTKSYKCGGTRHMAHYLHGHSENT